MGSSSSTAQTRSSGQRERGRGRLGDVNRKERRDETFVSPWVKWLMFSFNMLFWVSCFAVFFL